MGLALERRHAPGLTVALVERGEPAALVLLIAEREDVVHVAQLSRRGLHAASLRRTVAAVVVAVGGVARDVARGSHQGAAAATTRRGGHDGGEEGADVPEPFVR